MIQSKLYGILADFIPKTGDPGIPSAVYIVLGVAVAGLILLLLSKKKK